MCYQKYKDISLVFGAPFGERYRMLSGIAEQVNKPFSEIYLEFLTDVLKRKSGESLIEETLSIVTNEDLCIGEHSFTYQYWFEQREEFSKFAQKNESKEGQTHFPIRIPVLMLHPKNFRSKSGARITTMVQSEHAQYLAAMIAQVLQLDWIQTICALSKPTIKI